VERAVSRKRRPFWQKSPFFWEKKGDLSLSKEEERKVYQKKTVPSLGKNWRLGGIEGPKVVSGILLSPSRREPLPKSPSRGGEEE